MKKIKKIIFALLIINSSLLIAQNFPQGFNYQAVARDANGNAKTNATIGTRYTLRSGSLSGTVVWQETQAIITNAMGQFNHTIGLGTRIGGTALQFSEINWVVANHYLEVEIQIGAAPYASIGNQQLMAVPYALATPNGVPTGSVLSFAGPVTAPPVGWLVCDGSALNRTTYAALFASIGISWGAGDGTTTFNLPDMRGMFLRGVDGSAGNDIDAGTRIANNPGGNVGNSVGSEQVDALKSHNHTSNDASNKTGSAGGSTPSTLWFNGTSQSNTSATGGTETRPKNVYVNYIIKY